MNNPQSKESKVSGDKSTSSSSTKKKMTPLRWKILAGYGLVVAITIYGWAQIVVAWEYAGMLIAPAIAFLGAIVALKLSVVLASLFTIFTALLKIFISFLIAVLKPGIVKALLLPKLFAFAGWIHRKSERLQKWVGQGYEWGKAQFDKLYQKWKAQNSLDKVLLLGFMFPLLVLVGIVFILKRFAFIFVVKKGVEQLVQKVTKYTVANFYRVPVVGGVPAFVALKARRVTDKDSRKELIDDTMVFLRQLYKPEGATQEVPQAKSVSLTKAREERSNVP